MIAKKIGYGGDLFIPSAKYMQLTGGVSYPEVKTILSVGDLFLVHNKVSFRAEQWTLKEIYGGFTMDEIDELIKNDRISFYLPIYSRFYEEDWSDKIEEFFSKQSSMFRKEKIDPKRITKQVFDNLEPSCEIDEDFIEFKDKMFDLFYKHGIQRDSFFTMDRQIGFNQAIEKTRELWRSGIFSTSFDQEILFYFDICDKAAHLQEKTLAINAIDSSEHTMLDKLHLFKNMPTISEIIVKADDPVGRFLKIVNSDEARDFREWIQAIDYKNVDIRDFYTGTLNQLPSKKHWIDWTRFGSVTAISGILGAIVTANPALGILIGGATCALDKIYGDKVINSTVKKYNPEAWFSFIQSSNQKI